MFSNMIRSQNNGQMKSLTAVQIQVNDDLVMENKVPSFQDDERHRALKQGKRYTKTSEGHKCHLLYFSIS